MEITLKATVDLSERLYGTLDRLITVLGRFGGTGEHPTQPAAAVPAAKPEQPKSEAPKPARTTIPEVDSSEQDKKTAEEFAAKMPDLELTHTPDKPEKSHPTGEDVRRAVNSVRERIIGKDWEEQRQNGSERHNRYWTDVTTAIKQLAKRFGVTTAKAVPEADRSRFIIMLDNIGLDENENVVINTPF